VRLRSELKLQYLNKMVLAIATATIPRMDKYSRQDLQHLLETPDLLDSVYQTSHPQAQHNLQALSETWTTNRSIAGPHPSLQQGELTLTRTHLDPRRRSPTSPQSSRGEISRSKRTRSTMASKTSRNGCRPQGMRPPRTDD
jgi:hypothetical protein